ncbi:MAG: Crp/Fnr family transcriptional regulator [Brumimicrobium sp.]
MEKQVDFWSYLKSNFLISESSQVALKDACSIQKLQKNEVLQPIGHTCKTIYFLEEGVARIFYYKDGIDVTEYFALEGDFIARAESLFARTPSKKGIQILEDAKVIAVDVNMLYQLYDTHHEIERLFRLIFESAYVDTIQRIESFQFNSAEERYLDLIKNHKNIVRRIPLKHIASYLGITQVSLSRIRSKIK